MLDHMKLCAIFLVLVCTVLPLEAKKVKTPKSYNAKAFSQKHRAKKVKFRKPSQVAKKPRYTNRIN